MIPDAATNNSLISLVRRGAVGASELAYAARSSVVMLLITESECHESSQRNLGVGFRSRAAEELQNQSPKQQYTYAAPKPLREIRFFLLQSAKSRLECSSSHHLPR